MFYIDIADVRIATSWKWLIVVNGGPGPRFKSWFMGFWPDWSDFVQKWPDWLVYSFLNQIAKNRSVTLSIHDRNLTQLPTTVNLYPRILSSPNSIRYSPCGLNLSIVSFVSSHNLSQKFLRGWGTYLQNFGSIDVLSKDMRLFQYVVTTCLNIFDSLFYMSWGIPTPFPFAAEKNILNTTV